MKFYAFYMVALAVGLYGMRDWFVALCGLIIITAVEKHPEIRGGVFGLSGLNLWNLMFLAVIVGWILAKLRGSPGSGAPLKMLIAVALYHALIFLAYVRTLGHNEEFINAPAWYRCDWMGFTTELLINTVKYSIVAVLLFDAVRTRRQMVWAIVAILAQAAIYSFLTIKYIPIGSLRSGGMTDDFESEFRYRFQRDIGLHPNDLALVLVSTFWTLVAFLPILWKQRRWWLRGGALILLAAMFLSLALTNSRAGYLAFVLIGLTVAVLRWRMLLLGFPIALVVVCSIFPNIVTRMTLGFGEQTVSGETEDDVDAISAGRMNGLWLPSLPFVASSPLIGYGRLAIIRTVGFKHGWIGVTHPHNAYLEILLDSGVLGLIVVLWLYVGIPWMMWRNRDERDPLMRAFVLAGVCTTVGMLVMACTGQSFWPREGVITIQCMYAIMLRTAVMSRRANLARQRAVAQGYVSPARAVHSLPRAVAPRIARGSS